MHKDLKQFSLDEQKVILKFTEMLINRESDFDVDSIPEQEISNQVREYANKRNGGKNFLRSAPIAESENDKAIVAQVREWMKRKRK